MEVQVDYLWVSPICAHCKELGHISRNCLLLPTPPLKGAPLESKYAPKIAQKSISNGKTFVHVVTHSVVVAFDVCPIDLPLSLSHPL